MRLAHHALTVILLLLTGCVSPTPRENFYTLSSEATSPAASATPSDTSISVGPVSLSEIADRPQLVVRSAPNRVEILEQQRWAQPLRNEIARVVAENLRRLLNTGKVSAYPNQTPEADFRVALDIQAFESLPGSAARLSAAWTVRRADGSRAGGTTQIEEPVAAAATDYEALAAGHSRALARLSQDIAAAITAASNK